MNKPTRRELGVAAGSIISGVSGGYFLRDYQLENSRTYDNINNTTNIPDDAGDLPLSIGSRPKYGQLSSPIRIFYWVDFQCPYCFRFNTEIFPQLVEEYIQTGDAVITFKPITLYGSQSRETAVGSHAVYDLGIGTDYVNWKQEIMDYYHNNEEDLSEDWASPIKLRNFANNYGIDGDEYVSYIGSNRADKLMPRVNKDEQDYQTWGPENVQTPFFLIYDSRDIEPETLIGAQPFEEFKKVIESVRVDTGESESNGN